MRIIDTTPILFEALYDVYFVYLNPGQQQALDRVAADDQAAGLNLLLGQIATLDRVAVDESVAAVLATARHHRDAFAIACLDERQATQHRRAA